MNKLLQQTYYNAIKNNNLEMVKTLVNDEKLSLMSFDTYMDGSPLFVAMKSGSSDVAKFLLQGGATIYNDDRSGPPTVIRLYGLDEQTRHKCCDFLLNNKNLVDLKFYKIHDLFDNKYLFQKAKSHLFKNEIDKIIDLLEIFNYKITVNSKYKDNCIEKESLLLSCTSNNNIQLAENLLSKGISADLGDSTIHLIDNEKTTRKIQNFYTPLNEAVKRNNYQMVELLLKFKADPNLPNYKNYKIVKTPLELSIMNNNTKMAQLLLENGAKPLNLAFAIERENFEIAKAMIKHGAELNSLKSTLQHKYSLFEQGKLKEKTSDKVSCFGCFNWFKRTSENMYELKKS